MVAASDRETVIFSLSSGEASDSVEGRKFLESLGKAEKITYLLMDRAYEGDITQPLAIDLGYSPVVPPKSNRKKS